MSKEDKHKKKENTEEKPVSHDDSQAAEIGEEKELMKKDKKHSTEALQEELKQSQAKYEELNDKYIRLYSEFDNYRRRTQKERLELSKTASEDIIVSLLTVMDDLERALTLPVKINEEASFVPMEGLQLIYQKFKGLLYQKGLEAIPAIGESFDVDYHDAVTNIPAPTEEMKGKVVDEVEKGYKLNGKVIRYSKVVVGS